MSTQNRKEGAGGTSGRKNRLSEKLRENLRRRKAQMRLRAQSPAEPVEERDLPPRTGERE